GSQVSSVQRRPSSQSTGLHASTVVVVVEVVVVLVVDVAVVVVVVVLVVEVAVIVVVVVVLVVEVVVVMTTATRSSTQFSASALPVSESVVAWQSFGFFASSLAKQPFAGTAPPVYFAAALSTQPFVFGSMGFPGLWVSLRHLSSPARYFDAHFFLPAP